MFKFNFYKISQAPYKSLRLDIDIHHSRSLQLEWFFPYFPVPLHFSGFPGTDCSEKWCLHSSEPRYQWESSASNQSLTYENQNTWMAMSIVSKNAFEFMIETLIWLVSASFFSICCLNVEICSYGDQSHEESHVDILECPQVVHWQPIGWCCSFPLQSAC